MSTIPLRDMLVSISPRRLFPIALKLWMILAFSLFMDEKVITARYSFDYVMMNHLLRSPLLVNESTMAEFFSVYF